MPIIPLRVSKGLCSPSSGRFGLTGKQLQSYWWAFVHSNETKRRDIRDCGCAHTIHTQSTRLQRIEQMQPLVVESWFELGPQHWDRGMGVLTLPSSSFCGWKWSPASAAICFVVVQNRCFIGCIEQIPLGERTSTRKMALGNAFNCAFPRVIIPISSPLHLLF